MTDLRAAAADVLRKTRAQSNAGPGSHAHTLASGSVTLSNLTFQLKDEDRLALEADVARTRRVLAGQGG
jgi:hypothetical protein